MLSAAVVAGFVDSIVGGGGLIQVPALLAGYPDIAPREILATNKLGSLCGTTNAVVRYSRMVQISWRSLLPSAALAFLASMLGASCVRAVSPALFRPLIPCMLLVVLAYVLLHQDLGTLHGPRTLTGRQRLQSLAAISLVGLYDGFFGPGTGSFLMLLFIRVHGFDFLHAAAAARLVNVATNGGALIYFGAHADIHWALGLGLGSCNAVGTVIGTHTALRQGVKFVRVFFILVVGVLIAKTALDAIQVR